MPYGRRSFGQNAYFYDAAEGLLTATILLVAEFCAPEKRHIVSVFKIIQELLAPGRNRNKNQFQQLMELLPPDHKAKWFAGAALNTAEQSMAGRGALMGFPVHGKRYVHSSLSPECVSGFGA